MAEQRRASLLAARHELRQELATLRRQCRSCANAASRRRVRQAAGASGHTAVLLRVMVRLASSWEEARCLARRQGLFEDAPEAGGAGALPRMQEALAAPAVVLRARAALEARPPARVCRRAARLVAEARVLAWLRVVNARGVAPSAAALIAQLRVQWPAPGRDAFFLRFFLRMRHREQVRKAWARAFRRFWGVSWRRLPARADVPPDILRSRVLVCKKRARGVYFWSPWGDPKLRPFSGPENGPPPVEKQLSGAQFRGHFLAPDLGPHSTASAVSGCDLFAVGPMAAACGARGPRGGDDQSG
jgi:hypothetical protein